MAAEEVEEEVMIVAALAAVTLTHPVVVEVETRTPMAAAVWTHTPTAAAPVPVETHTRMAAPEGTHTPIVEVVTRMPRELVETHTPAVVTHMVEDTKSVKFVCSPIRICNLKMLDFQHHIASHHITFIVSRLFEPIVAAAYQKIGT